MDELEEQHKGSFSAPEKTRTGQCGPSVYVTVKPLYPKGSE